MCRWEIPHARAASPASVQKELILTTNDDYGYRIFSQLSAYRFVSDVKALSKTQASIESGKDMS